MKVVFDLDGTLSFDFQSIDEDIKRVLLRAPDYGHEVIFASTRSYRDSLGLLGEGLEQCLVIGLNGNVAYQGGKLVFKEKLDVTSYKEVLTWCQRYNLPFFVDDVFDYSGQILEKVPFISLVDPMKLARQKSLEEMTEPLKLVIYMGNHADILEDTRRFLQSFALFDVVYHAHEQSFYINPKGRNKAGTIEELCGQDVIAFGNDQNDIELFKKSLYAVQIGDFPTLKHHADDRVAYQDNLSKAVAAKILQVFADFRERA